mmetsp:Transcript_3126/g.7126  ORF Transcript_3126/g.7126 Transcript_3126/m.7126 type:complete len:210 (-) Transcript_3126:1180-1809(-)
MNFVTSDHDTQDLDCRIVPMCFSSTTTTETEFFSPMAQGAPETSIPPYRLEGCALSRKTTLPISEYCDVGTNASTSNPATSCGVTSPFFFVFASWISPLLRLHCSDPLIRPRPYFSCSVHSVRCLRFCNSACSILLRRSSSSLRAFVVGGRPEMVLFCSISKLTRFKSCSLVSSDDVCCRLRDWKSSVKYCRVYLGVTSTTWSLPIPII